jgi:hypothetical protein
MTDGEGGSQLSSPQAPTIIRFAALSTTQALGSGAAIEILINATINLLSSNADWPELIGEGRLHGFLL